MNSFSNCSHNFFWVLEISNALLMCDNLGLILHHVLHLRKGSDDLLSNINIYIDIFGKSLTKIQLLMRFNDASNDGRMKFYFYCKSLKTVCKTMLILEDVLGFPYLDKFLLNNLSRSILFLVLVLKELANFLGLVMHIFYNTCS